LAPRVPWPPEGSLPSVPETPRVLNERGTRREELQRILALHGERVDIAQAALLLAGEEYPSLDADGVLRRLDGWASRVRSGGGDVGALQRVLLDEEGLHGNRDNYYDPRNSFLNEVMEHKVGIPITLSVTCIAVARRSGLTAHGIGLPGHFLVGFEGGRYLDPFHGRDLLDADACRALVARLHDGRVPWSASFLEPWNARKILVRMLNNLKGIYLHHTDFDKALWVQDLLLLLLPDEAREYRDRGLVHAQLNHYSQARRDLKEYLDRSPGRPDDADAVEQDLQRLHRLQLMLN
jgi:regulator of sirC expression with transglutaminase-like and TPR domain